MVDPSPTEKAIQREAVKLEDAFAEKYGNKLSNAIDQMDERVEIVSISLCKKAKGTIQLHVKVELPSAILITLLIVLASGGSIVDFLKSLPGG